MTPSLKDTLWQGGLLVTFENTEPVKKFAGMEYSTDQDWEWGWMRFQPSINPPLYIAMDYILGEGKPDSDGDYEIGDSVESLEAEELWARIQPEDLPRFLVDSSDWWHRYHKTGTPGAAYTRELLVLASRVVLEGGVS